MFERFVAAYDGSEQAAAAVELALELTSRSDARLTLVHVLELLDPYPELPQMVPGIERMIALAEEEWRERLAQLAARARAAPAVEAEVVVATKAAPALLELLDDRRADVLIAGTHGVGGVKGMLGSVSHQMLEHAPCSVLLVRERPNLDGPRVVVAGIDGSGATPAVVATAQRAAAALSAELVLAHVIDQRLAAVASIDATHAVHAWAREQGQRILDDARASVFAPLDAVDEDLREGQATEDLVALCEERQPVLLVVGSRGRHGFKGLLLGSTARHVVNHAPCPVLVARTAPDEQGRAGQP